MKDSLIDSVINPLSFPPLCKRGIMSSRKGSWHFRGLWTRTSSSPNVTHQSVCSDVRCEIHQDHPIAIFATVDFIFRDVFYPPAVPPSPSLPGFLLQGPVEALEYHLLLSLAALATPRGRRHPVRSAQALHTAPRTQHAQGAREAHYACCAAKASAIQRHRSKTKPITHSWTLYCIMLRFKIIHFHIFHNPISISGEALEGCAALGKEGNHRTLKQELYCPESQQFYRQMIETWRGKVKQSLF